MTESEALRHGIVAHTRDNQARRYFEPHPTWPKPFAARNGERRDFAELVEPVKWAPGCGVRP